MPALCFFSPGRNHRPDRSLVGVAAARILQRNADADVEPVRPSPATAQQYEEGVPSALDGQHTLKERPCVAPFSLSGDAACPDIPIGHEPVEAIKATFEASRNPVA